MPVELIAKIQQKNDGTFKLLDVEDLDAGDLDVVMQLIAGGGVVAGADASAPVGEIAVQRKTTTGAPTHVATEATLCWSAVDEILYASQGGGIWVAVGGGTHPNLAVHDALGLATDLELAGGVSAAEGYADSAVSTHAGESDPHPGYATELEAQGLIDAALAPASNRRLITFVWDGSNWIEESRT